MDDAPGVTFDTSTRLYAYIASQVMASTFEVPENWVPPVHPKDADAEAFLKQIMSENKLMKSLTPSDREQLMKAFKKVEVRT